MRVATLCAGIGGADIGWILGGHAVVGRAEIDPFRRAVLARRFPGERLVERASDAPGACETPDLVYADMPGQPEAVASAWADVARAVAAWRPAWMVLEHSPARPFGRMARDLAMIDYEIQMLHVGTVIALVGLPPEIHDTRKRALLIGARDPVALDAIGLRSTGIDLTATIPTVQPGTAIEIEEQSRMLPPGWSCACGQRPCRCVLAARRMAVREATVPFLALWIGDVIGMGWARAHPGGRYWRHIPSEVVESCGHPAAAAC